MTLDTKQMIALKGMMDDILRDAIKHLHPTRHRYIYYTFDLQVFKKRSGTADVWAVVPMLTTELEKSGATVIVKAGDTKIALDFDHMTIQYPHHIPFGYVEKEPAEDAPVSDNPSGLYCRDCRASGLSHCGSVDFCGGMRRMKPAPETTPVRTTYSDSLSITRGLHEDLQWVSSTSS